MQNKTTMNSLSNVSTVHRLSLYIKATVLPDKRRGRTGADLVRITVAREEGFYYLAAGLRAFCSGNDFNESSRVFSLPVWLLG